jgi:hypothetical protein
MSIRIEIGDYVLGIWIFDNPPFNMLGLVTKHEDEWRFDSRSRYYTDNKVWDSLDPQHFWSVIYKEGITQAEIIEAVRAFFKDIATQFGDGEYHETLVRSSDPHMLHQAIKRTPFLHHMVL